MSNKAKPVHTDLIGSLVRHNFSNIFGRIEDVRSDQLGYSYYVKWLNYPEQSDWFQLNVLEILKGNL